MAAARRAGAGGNVFDLVQHLDALVFEITELIRELRPISASAESGEVNEEISPPAAAENG